MTQFTQNMIPTEIQTTEALAVWLAEVHAYLYGDTMCIEFLDENDEPISREVVEASKFRFTASTPGIWRHTSRHSVELAPEHLFGQAPWKHAKKFGDKPVPLEMRAA